MTSLPETDIAAEEHGPLIRGSGGYVADIDAPGRAHARIVRSYVAHGQIVDVDTTEAAAAEGVIAVLTGADLDEVPTIPVRIAQDPAMEGRRQPVIARDRVRYVGEPVAIVIAEDAYLAEDAAELVAVSIDPLPASVDANDEQANRLWDDGRSNVLATSSSLLGDVEAAFEAADLVLETTFKVQRHTGLPMETRGLTAVWEGDVLHLWGPTKYIHFTRTAVAGFLGIDPELVVCHHVDVGGMFGVRGEVYPEDFLVPWAAKHVGRPVSWVEDRSEHLVSINHARDQRHHYRLAIAADGRLLAFDDAVTLDQGAYPRPIGARVQQMSEKYLPGPYTWQAYRAATTAVATNKTPAGTMRGPSGFEAAYVRERMIDVAARQLDIDPVELRRRNLIRPEAMPFTFELSEGADVHYDTGDFPAGVDHVLEQVDFAGIRDEVTRRRSAGEHVGVGLALFLESSGGGLEESVELALGDDGSFVMGTSAAEIGQSLRTMMRKVVAREAGVALDGLRIDVGDTQAHAGGTGTYGSRTTIFVGSAVADATNRLLAEACDRAAEQLGVDADALEIRADGIGAGADHRYWKDLAPIDVVGRHEGPSLTFGFGLHIAVVRVDAGLGAVEVERLVVAYDTGVAIDIDNVRSQLVGASIQAMGGAMFEELAYGEDGQPQTTTFIDYLVPTSAESPRVECVVIESGAADGNPLGAKGAGESGMIGVPGAIANAVADAIGSREICLTELPLKPARVLDAIDGTRA
ncbi:MAG: xanthine dehydrogenase family protein molybdopterin-binding subunit [Nitriliruptoraceae bacterium]|nr:xanthine dehydrogenase family protein molybdopterin-binding subunit [Nitriliruptoraceae bacterium]